MERERSDCLNCRKSAAACEQRQDAAVSFLAVSVRENEETVARTRQRNKCCVNCLHI